MVTVVAGLILFAGLFLLIASGVVRLSAVWGGIWGPLLGFALVAPKLLAAHRLYPDGFWQWVVVDGYLAGVFVVLGIILSFATSWPIGIREVVARRPFRRPWLAAGLWSLVALPVGYLCVSLVTERLFLTPEAVLVVVATTAGMAGVAAVALTFVYRRFAIARAGEKTRTLIVAAGILVLLAMVLPIRVGPPPRTERPTVPPLVPAPVQTRTPLLVLGIDAGNWRTLRPLIERGAAPTFAAIMREGVHGVVDAPWPPYWSGPAWAAILTGHSKEEAGVFEDINARAPGLPPFPVELSSNRWLNPILVIEFLLTHLSWLETVPITRDQLRWPPVWDRLSAVGKNVAVVRFPFTYPAAGPAAFVVSDRIGTDLWSLAGVRPGQPELVVHPRAETAPVLELFHHPEGLDALEREILSAPPAARPRDAWVDPRYVLRRSLQSTEGVLAISERRLAADPNLDVLMLYIGAFDGLCHAFWPYRFPEDFPADPPAPADVRDLGSVIDRYLIHLDGRLGRLIQRFPAPPNVVIVSDHGAEATRFSTLWRGWHSNEGVFLAAGPSIRHDPVPRSVSYYDVAPTVLDLLSITPASDLRGRSIVVPR